MLRELLLGYASRKITPEVPISLAGYFNVRMWDKVLDDLYVRALILKQGETLSAIVQFDLVTVSNDFLERVRQEVADLPQLTVANTIFTATHTHTGPEIRESKRGGNPEYNRFAAKKASEAIREALVKLQPATLVKGGCSDDRFGFNRRYWMKDGTVVTNPGKLNPEIDRPEGEMDPEIPLLGFKVDGKLKVVLANIVNHTDTIGGNGVSADWAGFFRRRLERDLGANSMVMPLIGCAGNINHFDVSTDRDQTCYAEAKRIGEGYAETVKRALDNLVSMGDVCLEVGHTQIKVGSREISSEEIKEAQRDLERFADVPDPTTGGTLTSEDLARKSPAALKYFASALLSVAKNQEERTFNLVGIRLGESAIVSLPSEPFVEIGLEIKQKILQGKQVFVVSHSNGTGSCKIPGAYIPNRYNFGRGGYETMPRSSSNSIETADKLLEGIRTLSRDLFA